MFADFSLRRTVTAPAGPKNEAWRKMLMSLPMDSDERAACALLKDGDLGEFEHPYDTLALRDSVECAAGLAEDSNGTPVLSRPRIPRSRRFWHTRARSMSAYDFFTMFRCRSEFTERLLLL